MDRAAAWANGVKEWLPWLAVFAFVFPAALGVELSPHAERFLERHGLPTVILLAALAYVPRFLRAHQQLAAAVQQFSERDDYRHREVLGVLSVLAEDMRDVKTHVRTLTRSFDGDGK